MDEEERLLPTDETGATLTRERRAEASQNPPIEVDPAVTPSKADERHSGGTSFSPGQMISARFRIIRFIARGGMGEVYEAEDLQLSQHIALKTILPGIAALLHKYW